ncbi:hypothetical protein QAD02_002179 [Eretmocerus hayati]|uniref:Uncharacterized protein n=1 Tax=Eretmocerus hayati TaxID=131215 RepID=A0ACC2NMZ9_9HYME|nr:hypothetical protein QAD02_002179 [Eretmocerus hayati]
MDADARPLNLTSDRVKSPRSAHFAANSFCHKGRSPTAVRFPRPTAVITSRPPPRVIIPQTQRTKNPSEVAQLAQITSTGIRCDTQRAFARDDATQHNVQPQASTLQQLPEPSTVLKLNNRLQAPTTFVIPKGNLFFHPSDRLSATNTLCGKLGSLQTGATFFVPGNNTLWIGQQTVPSNHPNTKNGGSASAADPHNSSERIQPIRDVPLAAKVARLCSSRRSSTFGSFASSSNLLNESQCSSSPKKSSQTDPRRRRSSQSRDCHGSSGPASESFGYFLGTLHQDAFSQSNAASTIESILNSIPKATVSQVFED